MQRFVLSISLPFLLFGLVYVWYHAMHNMIYLTILVLFLLCVLHKLSIFISNENKKNQNSVITVLEPFDLYKNARTNSNNEKIHPLMEEYLKKLQNPIENFFSDSDEDN